jgi:hypothetical protein
MPASKAKYFNTLFVVPYSSSSIVMTSLQLRHWKVMSFGSPPSFGMTEASVMLRPQTGQSQILSGSSFSAIAQELRRARKDEMINLNQGGGRGRFAGLPWGAGGREPVIVKPDARHPRLGRFRPR